jgi:hypothetical protein
MSSANDIITLTLKNLGVKQPGETLTGDEAQDGLDRLNLMLDKWNNEKLMLSYHLNSTKTLTSGTYKYAIGVGWDVDTAIITDNAGTYTAGSIISTINGTAYTQTYDTDKNTTLTALAAQVAAHADVDSATYSSTAHTITLKANPGSSLYVATTLTSITGTMTMAVTESTASGTIAKPLKIESAFIRDSSTDTPLKIISNAEYQAIAMKSTAGFPEKLFYNPVSPYGYIYLWPTPDSAYTLSISQLNQLAQMTLSATIILPNGYLGALVDNLTVELAPMFGVPVTMSMMKAATDSKNAIKQTNAMPTELKCGVDVLGSGGGFDINRGW